MCNTSGRPAVTEQGPVEDGRPSKVPKTVDVIFFFFFFVVKLS